MPVQVIGFIGIVVICLIFGLLLGKKMKITKVRPVVEITLFIMVIASIIFTVIFICKNPLASQIFAFIASFVTGLIYGVEIKAAEKKS